MGFSTAEATSCLSLLLYKMKMGAVITEDPSVTTLSTAQAHSRLSTCSLLSSVRPICPEACIPRRGAGEGLCLPLSLFLSLCRILSSSSAFFERQNVSISQSGRGHHELPSLADSGGRDLEHRSLDTSLHGIFLPSPSSHHLLQPVGSSSPDCLYSEPTSG